MRRGRQGGGHQAGGGLVEVDQIAQGDRDRDMTVGERVEADLILQLRHQDGDAQGVEAGLEQLQIVGQGRQRLVLLPGDALDLGDDGGAGGGRRGGHAELRTRHLTCRHDAAGVRARA